MILIDLVVQGSEEEWATKYFKSEEYRLTALTEPHLPQGYYQKFAMHFVALSEFILFRAKVSDSALNNVRILTVWKNRAKYEEFARLVEGDLWFGALKKIGLHFDISIQNITKEEVVTLATRCLSSPYRVFQIVSSEFVFPGMTVGDPFKGDTLYTVD